MMKILVSSDQHHYQWGQFAYKLPNGLTSRIQEGLDAEDFLLQLVQKDPAILYHLRVGDLFERKHWLDSVVLKEIVRRVQTASASLTSQIFLDGNHDQAAGGVRSNLEVFEAIDGSQVVHKPQVLGLYEGNVRIYCVPYMDVPSAELAETIDSFRPDPAYFNILAVHAGVNEAKQGSEYSIPLNFTLADLKRERFDVVVLGHYHEPQQLADNVYIIGSLLQRTWADEGSPRRCLVIDTATGTVESIPIPGARFRSVRVANLEALDRYDIETVRGDYVRVVTSDATLTQRVVRNRFDGVAKGSTLAYVPEATPTESEVRALGSGRSWSEVMTSWVQRAETSLDKAKLLTLGNDIIDEALTDLKP